MTWGGGRAGSAVVRLECRCRWTAAREVRSACRHRWPDGSRRSRARPAACRTGSSGCAGRRCRPGFESRSPPMAASPPSSSLIRCWHRRFRPRIPKPYGRPPTRWRTCAGNWSPTRPLPRRCTTSSRSRRSPPSARGGIPPGRCGSSPQATRHHPPCRRGVGPWSALHHPPVYSRPQPVRSGSPRQGRRVGKHSPTRRRGGPLDPRPASRGNFPVTTSTAPTRTRTPYLHTSDGGTASSPPHRDRLLVADRRLPAGCARRNLIHARGGRASRCSRRLVVVAADYRCGARRVRAGLPRPSDSRPSAAARSRAFARLRCSQHCSDP